MSSSPLEASGAVWMADSVIHVGDHEFAAGRPVASYVVAGDGVYFVEADSLEDEGGQDSGPVWFVRPGVDAEETGLEASGAMRVSPDGRYLVLLDHEPTKAEIVVVDLAEGEVDRTDDTFDPGLFSLDPEWEMGEAEVELLGIDDDAVHARGLEGIVRIDLATLDVEEVADDEDAGADDGLVSPDGTWRIDEADRVDSLVGPAATVVPRISSTPESAISLYHWSTPETVVGATIDEDRRALVTCTVPEGACKRVDESAGKQVWFPTNSGSDVRGVDLGYVP